VSWGYRKQKKLAPGVNLNLSKRSIGVSFGRRGARVSANSRGDRCISLGFRGLFWRKRM